MTRKAFSTIVCCFALMLFSCEEAPRHESTQPPHEMNTALLATLLPEVNEASSTSVERGSPTSALNEANPFDHIGIAHNDALADLQARYADASLDDADVRLQICEETGISPEMSDFFYENFTLEGFETGYTAALEQVENPLLRAFAKRLIGQTSKAAKSGIINTEKELIQYVLHVEQSIADSPQLKEEEKAELLSATSLFRMSAIFWAQPANGGAGHNTAVLMGRTFWQYLAIVAADVAAGFVGGWAAAYYGSLIAKNLIDFGHETK